MLLVLLLVIITIGQKCLAPSIILVGVRHFFRFFGLKEMVNQLFNVQTRNQRNNSMCTSKLIAIDKYLHKPAII